MNPKLTCIICFKNEGNWIETTVKSIRESTEDVEILLINDCSDDGFNYGEVAERYGCRYLCNDQTLGVAGSRDLGVKNCETPYFILLDGHMKFPERDWDKRIIGALDTHPKSIVITNTIVMFLPRKSNTIRNLDCKDKRYTAFGAYINFNEPWNGLQSIWSRKPPKEGEELMEIPSVLGATYASSVEWWNYIGGLHGLISYGEDESLMSIKTWLFGGKCYIIPYLGIAHLYRVSKPYESDRVDHTYNKMFLTDLFIDDPELHDDMIKKISNTIKKDLYKDLMSLREKQLSSVLELKKFIKERQVIDFNYYRDNINKPFLDYKK